MYLLKLEVKNINAFIEEVNKIALSANDNKRIQSIDSIETYAYGISKDPVCKEEEIKCNNVIKQYKKWLTLIMLQKKENIKEYNPNWLQILDHLYRILIIGTSRSRKTNSLFNLVSHQPNIDKIYLYTKDPYEAKYQLLVNKRESTGLKHLNYFKAFMEY